MSGPRNTNALAHGYHRSNPQQSDNPMWHQRSESRQMTASRTNPEISRLFSTPASRRLDEDDDASVVILREVSYGKTGAQMRTTGNGNRTITSDATPPSGLPSHPGQRPEGPKNTIQAGTVPSNLPPKVPVSSPQFPQPSPGSPSMLTHAPAFPEQPFKSPVQNRSSEQILAPRTAPGQNQASAHQLPRFRPSYGQQTNTQHGQGSFVRSAQQTLQPISHTPQNIPTSRTSQTTIPRSYHNQNALHQPVSSSNKLPDSIRSHVSPQQPNNNAHSSRMKPQPGSHHESQGQIAQKYQDKPRPEPSKTSVPLPAHSLQSQHVRSSSRDPQNTRGLPQSTSNNNKRSAESDKGISQPPPKKRVQLQPAPVAINGVPTATTSKSHEVSAPTRSPATHSSPSHLATAAEVLAQLNVPSATTTRQQHKEQLQRPSVEPAVALTSKEMMDVLSGSSLSSSSKKVPRSGEPDRAPSDKASNRSSSSNIISPTPSTSNDPSDNVEAELNGALDEVAKAIRRQLAGRVKKNFSHKLDSARKYLLLFAAAVPADRSGFKEVLKLFEKFDWLNYEDEVEKAHARIVNRRKEKENEKKVHDTVKRLQALEEALTKMKQEFPDNEDNWTVDQKKLYRPAAAKFNELFKEYVNLTGDGCEVRNEAHKNLLRPIDLTEATNYSEINLAVQEYINASKEEFKHSLALSVEEIHSPCFSDIKEIVDNASAELSLKISREGRDRLARTLYNAILQHNQAGRCQDSLMCIYEQAGITDETSRRKAFGADPALHSPELDQTLRKNSDLAEANMDAVLDLFAHMSQSANERDDDADSIRTEVLNPDDEDSYDLEDLIAGLTGPDVDYAEVPSTSDQDLSMFDDENALPQQPATCTGSRTTQDYEGTTMTFHQAEEEDME